MSDFTTTNNRHTILFYGTEQFGAAMLQALIHAESWNIIGAVTQPDRPAGRKNELKESPVKLLAQRNNIPVFQPESLKTIEFSPESLPISDLQIVCQYGLIIPKRIVEAPKFGTINVHTSLLPKYRGASPIQTAILQGETETGITIMQMDEKMDHGGIFLQEKILISPNDTTPTLSQKMIPVAQHLLVTAVKKWFAAEIEPHEQQHAEATFCRQFEKSDGLMDFSCSTEELYNRFRAFFPWPGTFAYWNGAVIKFLNVQPSNEPAITPGKILIHDKRIFIGTTTQPLEILQVQREGGKPLAAKDFLAGARDFGGAQLVGKQKEGTEVPPTLTSA